MYSINIDTVPRYDGSFDRRRNHQLHVNIIDYFQANRTEFVYIFFFYIFVYQLNQKKELYYVF